MCVLYVCVNFRIDGIGMNYTHVRLSVAAAKKTKRNRQILAISTLPELPLIAYSYPVFSIP